MADVKISALPAASALTGTELIPAVQSGTTVRTTPNDLATFLDSGAASKGFAVAMAVALG